MNTLALSPHKTGGVGKTTDNLLLIDALVRLKVDFRAFDADTHNRKLSEFYPAAIPIDITNEEQVVELIVSTGAKDAPSVTVVDFPAGGIGMVETVFQEIDLEALAAQGIRVVQLVHATNDPISIAGALAWAREFSEVAEFAVFANRVHGDFDLESTADGKRLYEVAEGQVATIPRIRSSLRNIWLSHPTLPSLLAAKHSAELNWIQARQFGVLADELFAAVEPLARFVAMKKSKAAGSAKK